ncbi:CocE/NonD family hydrolase [Streptomyces sp. AMCC400023]|uniref:CocE/NonD family hydrolase n=1 Tax=Streptomyces sp. AMCC400023 TaxID=2056258 RepID=UPI001EFF61EE|nr:CocE/NonD family hydrolase [Streptomyces sp. AMCC400023]UJV45571.1 hypothetical protein CVT30_42125 [Streptomyces sp. AMCC400023]
MTTTLPRPTGPTPPSPAVRATDRLLTRLMRLPGTRHGYRVERNIPTPARDGAVLVTDHYAPVTGRPKGTVLVRTPYGRGFPHDLEARVYADRGYHVVLQSCRGTFGSTGDFSPMANAADAATGHRAPWFREWLTTPERGAPVWERLKLDDALQRADVPVRLTAGWQDLFLDQTLHQYESLRARGIDVSLTVGPWTHQELGQKGMGRLLRGNLAWLETHLAGEGPAQPRSAFPVEVYVTGQGAWRQLAAWPPATGETVRHLQPGGRLLADAPNDGPPSTYLYDPADPTPTLGGPLLTLDAGSKDNAELESRPDVLTFTTDPLTAPLEIMGTPVIELAHTRSNPHADVFVRLCDVDPKGVSRNVAEGLLRLDPASPLDQAQTVRVRLDACAHQVKAGHRIRLLIAGGSHPRYARNEGTGELPGAGSELRSCTHTVHHDSGAVSRVILPTPSG